MNYKLYTLIDITHTGQYRAEPGKEFDRWKEQNFNTIIQTLGLRSNIIYFENPSMIEINGSIVGFETDDIIRVWRFDFTTEREDVYLKDDDSTGFLKDDFEMVPYIAGLDELIEQNYNVFITDGFNKNIVFHKKE